MCERCSKLIPERRCSGVFVVNFEQISHCSDVTIVDFEQVNANFEIKRFGPRPDVKNA